LRTIVPIGSSQCTQDEDFVVAQTPSIRLSDAPPHQTAGFAAGAASEAMLLEPKHMTFKVRFHPIKAVALIGGN
jgi:hypothetical protein